MALLKQPVASRPIDPALRGESLGSGARGARGERTKGRRESRERGRRAAGYCFREVRDQRTGRIKGRARPDDRDTDTARARCGVVRRGVAYRTILARPLYDATPCTARVGCLRVKISRERALYDIVRHRDVTTTRTSRESRDQLLRGAPISPANKKDLLSTSLQPHFPSK